MGIEEKIFAGDVSGAVTDLGNFDPGSNIQQNYKDFYSIYGNYFSNGVLNASDSISLAELVLKCPFIEGPIVYNARALYDLITYSVMLYNDDVCEPRGGSRKANAGNTSFQPIYYQLFPNPTTEELNITGKEEKENIKIIISDVNGRIFLEQATKTNNYATSLKLNLMNGIYFVTLINKDNERIVKKLVIAK